MTNQKSVYLQDKSVEKPQDTFADHTLPRQAPDYKVRAGDVLYIQISKLNTVERAAVTPGEEISAATRSSAMHPYLVGYTVTDSGFVDLPVIGKVGVAGIPLPQLQNVLTHAVAQVYRLPSVRVYLLNFNVTVLGEVANPGRYPVYTTSLNALEALGLAGDVAEFGDRRHVRVLRGQGASQQLYTLDLTDMLTATKAPFYLQPGDVIMVSPLKSKKFANRGVQWAISAIGATALVFSLLINLNR